MSVSAQTIARGKYMVQTGHCNNCHTSGYTRKEGDVPEKERLLGSAPLGYRGPWGTTYASNRRLTVQNFTQAQWIKDAKAVQPRLTMPWWSLDPGGDENILGFHALQHAQNSAVEPAYNHTARRPGLMRCAARGAQHALKKNAALRARATDFQEARATCDARYKGAADQSAEN